MILLGYLTCSYLSSLLIRTHFFYFRYTMGKSLGSSMGYSVYAIVLEWPDNNTLKLGAPSATVNTTVTMLGYNRAGAFALKPLSPGGKGVSVTFPYIPPNKLPSMYTWVLRFDNLNN